MTGKARGEEHTTQRADQPRTQATAQAAAAKTDVKTDVTHSPAGDVTSTTETTSGAGGAKTVRTTQDRPGGGSETRTDTTAGASAECVVNDGTHHTGRAVPGTKVCSAHTFRYYNDGTPRDPSATGQAPKVVEKDTLTDTDPRNQMLVQEAAAKRDEGRQAKAAADKKDEPKPREVRNP